MEETLNPQEVTVNFNFGLAKGTCLNSKSVPLASGFCTKLLLVPLLVEDRPQPRRDREVLRER